MARDTLIFLNYQREIPPFMISQLEYASEYFDKVYYVTRTLENDNRGQVRADNVEFVDAGHFASSPAALWKARGVLAKGGAGDFARAVRDGAFSGGLVKSSLVSELASTLLYEAAERLLDGLDDEKVVVFSVWFMTEAMAAARVKVAHPSVRAVSFAHSFEVQDEKDALLDYRRLAFRHEHIDEIHFISRMVLERYRLGHMAPHGIGCDNVDVVYLGSPMPLSEGAGPSDDGVLRIVSCSGLTPVKRVPLLVESLALLAGSGVRFSWTHLGGGPMDGEVRSMAAEMLPAGSATFAGPLSNREVHEYYRDNPVDLFVNVSAMEGLPVSIMEALSYGIPSIATDVGGNSEVTRDGETGVLLGADPSPREIADAMSSFAALSGSERGRYRGRCRSLWESDFDAAENARALYLSVRES